MMSSSTPPLIWTVRCATPTGSSPPSSLSSPTVFSNPTVRARSMSEGGGPPTLLRRGKVRELYDAGNGLLLMVASDRIRCSTW